MSSSSSVALIAEFLGTFLLVLTVLATGGNPLAVGGVVAGIIFLVGAISGGQINPAISLANVLTNTMSWTKFMGYVAVQLLGATAAVYAYRAAVVSV